jgi:hypothetical protein
VDNNGNILFLGIENDGIALINDKMKTIGYTKIKKEYYYYLFKKPDSILDLDITYKSGLRLNEIMIEISINDQILILFKPSSTLGTSSLSCLSLTSFHRLLPRDALRAYEKELKKMSKEYFKEMFFLIFNDEKERDFIYLQYGENIENGKNCVYQFNSSGKLIKVLYVKCQIGNGFVRLFCKLNENYFGIADRKIKIFKEER